MLTFAFHDSKRCPEYFADFVAHACHRVPLTLLTPARGIPCLHDSNKDGAACRVRLTDPRTLPGYLKVAEAFDDLFFNYSVNSKAFERACFLRWFAVNAATTTLDDNEHVCVLDTDFLLGQSPQRVLAECTLAAGYQPDFVAEWQGREPRIVGPEFTIIKKSYLFDFCEYLLTTYFSPASKSRLVGEYFRVIGKGKHGGISDMTALGSFAQLNADRIFNLQSLGPMSLIGNLNLHLATDLGQSDDWKVTFHRDGHVISIAGCEKPLIGTHCQGSAKIYMALGRSNNGLPEHMTRATCRQHHDSLLARWKSQNPVRKAFAYAKNAYTRYFR